MKFTPEIEFEGGKVRPLTLDDLDHLWNIYQQPELPGQSKPKEKEQLARLVDYSIKMAATQRGMMWLLEVDGQVLGMVNVYDWQASLLRLTMRVDGLPELSIKHRQAALSACMDFLGVDGLPELSIKHRQAALSACMDFLAKKYHTRNFAYQWIDGQKEEIKTMLTNLGFELRATLRDAWRVGNSGFANIEQYHLLNNQEKPKAGRLGEFDNPAQNINKDVPTETQKETK